ncbi:hypothetical protein Saut_0974 [Sulfurimonas autotrophica DSM 16294]|uniref:Uncharacterized protein n=2 Tax=Sulfurimonas autotrophica TaxID=202747 RepID=E0US00_SULAO|nr:hypothetical protein Saut_0974 [Sulfurimonas autotrophica DSM 16294]
MHKDYSAYIQFLAADYNILYIGKENENLIDKISSYFKTLSKITMNENMLNKIATTLSKRDINVVVIDAKENETLANQFFQRIHEYDSDIITILLFDSKQYEKLSETIYFVDAVIFYPIIEQLFYKKLFSVLSTPYAIKSIGRREIAIKQDVVKENSIDKFFDTYEGSSLFIADDLTDIVMRLNAGELSQELFSQIAEKLDDVANIFSKSSQTISITPIYQELASYLRNIKIQEIKPEHLKAFDYLSEILSDVSVYLLDMFVDRIFKDVYIFEHSLENNIIFMKSQLEGKEDDEDNSELEFF